MLPVGGTQTQIDKIHALACAPIKRVHQELDTCHQVAIKDLDGINLSRWRLLANRRRDRGSMSQAIEIVVAIERHAPGHALDMRMCGIYAAVNYGDADTHRLLERLIDLNVALQHFGQQL